MIFAVPKPLCPKNPSQFAVADSASCFFDERLLGSEAEAAPNLAFVAHPHIAIDGNCVQPPKKRPVAVADWAPFQESSSLGQC